MHVGIKYLSLSEGRSDPTWIEEPTLQKEAISREALATNGCQGAGQPGNHLKVVGKSDDREGKAMPENGGDLILLSQRLFGPIERPNYVELFSEISIYFRRKRLCLCLALVRVYGQRGTLVLFSA